MSQTEHSKVNRIAWSHRAYEAWSRGYGTPQEAAQQLKADPESVMRETWKYFGDVQGKSVANLLGSCGRRAVALSLLGADVTVVDISEENQRYALELAGEAGVCLDYIVADVSAWDAGPYADRFDFVFMEYGILHYFVDLGPLVQRITTILKPAGRLILHEYHPLNRKCRPELEGDRLYLRGDYFGRDVHEKPAQTQVNFTADEVAAFPLAG